jgi:dihydropyrimidinase
MDLDQLKARPPHNVLIQNGTVVTGDRAEKTDLLVINDTIADISKNMTLPESDDLCLIIDAKDKYVCPGGIDVHTHLNLDIGIAVAQDDFYTGTKAAAMGGTTTIIDHPGFGPERCSVFHQIDKYHGYAKNNAVIDYSFHGVLQHLDDQVLKDLPRLADQGITSMKAYMTYDHRFTDDMLLRLFKAAKKNNILITIHAEDDTAISDLRATCVRNGHTHPRYHALSRPPCTEAHAVERVIELAKKAGNAPVYIVHLSTKQGLGAIRSAKASDLPIIAETCPQYLFLDDSLYDLPDLEGLKYIMSPPLRSKSHLDALWKGIADTTIKVVATDHCPFDFQLKKKLASHDFTKCPGGAPGIEARVALLFSKGVMEKKITLQQFVRVMAENPARIMGLYPKKGVLAVGSDADLILVDPEKKVMLSHDMLHENVDYSPYEGLCVKGFPVLTMVRGKIIMKDNVFMGSKGFGQFIKRKRYGGKIG